MDENKHKLSQSQFPSHSLSQTHPPISPPSTVSSSNSVTKTQPVAQSPSNSTIRTAVVSPLSTVYTSAPSSVSLSTSVTSSSHLTETQNKGGKIDKLTLDLPMTSGTGSSGSSRKVNIVGSAQINNQLNSLTRSTESSVSTANSSKSLTIKSDGGTKHTPIVSETQASKPNTGNVTDTTATIHEPSNNILRRRHVASSIHYEVSPVITGTTPIIISAPTSSEPSSPDIIISPSDTTSPVITSLISPSSVQLEDNSPPSTTPQLSLHYAASLLMPHSTELHPPATPTYSGILPANTPPSLMFLAAASLSKKSKEYSISFKKQYNRRKREDSITKLEEETTILSNCVVSYSINVYGIHLC